MAVAVAAAVLVLVNLPATTVIGNTKGAAHHAGRVHQVVPTTSVAVVPVSAEAAAVALPETPALRHRLRRGTQRARRAERAVRLPAQPRDRRHRRDVRRSSRGAPALRLRQLAPNDPHPLNHFPGEP